MLAVCAVLSIAAMVAIPSAQPVDESRADAAAGEVVLALRFARDEALRTGEWRMFTCEPQRNQVRVFGLGADGASLAEQMVPHPGNRQPYAVALAAAPAGGHVALARCSFVFAAGGTAMSVAFDGAGNPVRGTGSATVRAQPLQSGTIVLGTGNATRTVAVNAAGRVTAS
nr:hypothetical protein [Pseudoduganella lutea]